jgi:hypothetical protein
MTVLRRLALLAAGTAVLLVVPATAGAATELTRGVLRDAPPGSRARARSACMRGRTTSGR